MKGVICVLAITLQACAVQRPLETASNGSWRELRDRNVVRQQLDYSCGAAALATLIRYYFGDDVTEERILADILGSMTAAEVLDREANGLSLLDLRQQAERMGYQAVGVQLTLAALPKLTGPVIVHLEGADYRHFAVLKGVREDRIYLADPSLGNVRRAVDRFAKEWTGIALVLGKEGFALPQAHSLALDDRHLVPNEVLPARKSLLPR
jgi:predicted double-glycine peptidase